jgi:hypothetical protein
VSTSIPRQIQWLDFSQIYGRSFRRFGVSGIGSSCIPHLELPFAEILKLRFTLPLDPTVKSSPTIYGVDRFGFSGFRYFPSTCENKVLPFWFPRVPKLVQTATCFPQMDGPDEFRDFAYRDFHVPVQLQRVFKPCAHFPDLTVTRVLLPSRTDPKAPTLLVWSPLSLWPYTTPAAVS